MLLAVPIMIAIDAVELQFDPVGPKTCMKVGTGLFRAKHVAGGGLVDKVKVFVLQEFPPM